MQMAELHPECIHLLHPFKLHTCFNVLCKLQTTVKILKFGTPQTIAIIVLKLVKFDLTLH